MGLMERVGKGALRWILHRKARNQASYMNEVVRYREGEPRGDWEDRLFRSCQNRVGHALRMDSYFVLEGEDGEMRTQFQMPLEEAKESPSYRPVLGGPTCQGMRYRSTGESLYATAFDFTDVYKDIDFTIPGPEEMEVRTRLEGVKPGGEDIEMGVGRAVDDEAVEGLNRMLAEKGYGSKKLADVPDV